MMQVLLLTTLVGAAILVAVGGPAARRAGIPAVAGAGMALTLLSVAAILAPGSWRQQLLAGDAGEPILVFARELGLTGAFFLAGMNLKLDTRRATGTAPVAVALAGLLFCVAVVVLLVTATGADWSPSIVIAASMAASSVLLPSQRSSELGNQSAICSAAIIAAMILGGTLLLAVHLLGSFHEVAGRANSISDYAIVAAFEAVKIALFFSFAWFVSKKFIDRMSDVRGVSDIRIILGFSLVAVLVFLLGRLAIGDLGTFVWSFVAGVLFTRSEPGKRLRRYSPGPGALFLSLSILPLFLQTHGRVIAGVPMLAAGIVGALALKFALGAVAARTAGYSRRGSLALSASTLAPGELTVALLAFGLTRWMIDGPEYFAGLFFALLSMIVAPIATRAASEQHAAHPPDPESPGNRLKRKQGQAAEASGHLKAGVAIGIAGAALVLLGDTAPAQTVAPRRDDPVSRAMAAVEASVDHRAEAAARVLEASKLVTEARAARKQGKAGLAREAVTRAESIAGVETFNRSALIDELLRLVAEERTTLDSPPARDGERLPAAGSIAAVVPGPARARLGRYREAFARILEQERVPVGLLGVALVESGFNPFALSSKGARGIWQFMPATAIRYGLTIQPGNDDRTHPERSTRAAARYLRDLYHRFHDWKLALAAYNAGEERVQQIIDRTGIRDFDEMSRRKLLPLETRKYVPSVLAVWPRLEPDASGETR